VYDLQSGGFEVVKERIREFIHCFGAKGVNGANRRSRSQQPPAKVLVLIGASDGGEDTQLIRHFVLEILRSEMNLNI